MVTLQATKVPIDVEALAEAARRAPVTVMNGDIEAFVVVEPAEFRKLMQEAAKARRIEAGRRALALLPEIDRNVAERATAEELAQIERGVIDED